MCKKVLTAIVFFAIAAAAVSVYAKDDFAEVKVFFSPEDNCQDEIIFYLDEAKASIYIAMYLITSRLLSAAVSEAKKRGVDVKICLDAEQAKEKYSKSNFLSKKGIPIKMVEGAGIMHHKFCVIDDEIVITGSYNWTRSANNKNDENLLVIKSKKIADKYKEEFKKLWNGKKLDYKPFFKH